MPILKLFIFFFPLSDPLSFRNNLVILSVSFAGMVFLSLYLSGKIRVFDRKGRIAKICVVILPLLVAALVGISRVDDYWHHWQDVFAGGLLGLCHWFSKYYSVSNQSIHSLYNSPTPRKHLWQGSLWLQFAICSSSHHLTMLKVCPWPWWY